MVVTCKAETEHEWEKHNNSACKYIMKSMVVPNKEDASEAEGPWA